MSDNEIIQEKGWFKRNWKWAVPLGGCLSMIIILIIVLVSTFFGVRSVINNSEYEKEAMIKLNENERVIELLGDPVEKVGMNNYSFNWINGVKEVNMEISVSGPKESGVLHIDADIKGGDWDYDELYIKIDNTDEKIDILKD